MVSPMAVMSGILRVEQMVGLTAGWKALSKAFQWAHYWVASTVTRTADELVSTLVCKKEMKMAEIKVA